MDEAQPLLTVSSGLEIYTLGKKLEKQLQNVFLTVLPQEIISLLEFLAHTILRRKVLASLSHGRSGDTPVTHPLAEEVPAFS